jgi:hypothetical protein
MGIPPNSPPANCSLVDRLFVVNDNDLSPANTVLFNSIEDANQIYRLLIHQKFTFDGTKLIVLQSETTGCPMSEMKFVIFGNVLFPPASEFITLGDRPPAFQIFGTQ